MASYRSLSVYLGTGIAAAKIRAEVEVEERDITKVGVGERDIAEV